MKEEEAQVQGFSIIGSSDGGSAEVHQEEAHLEGSREEPAEG